MSTDRYNDFSEGADMRADFFVDSKRSIQIPRRLIALGAAGILATGLGLGAKTVWGHVTRRVDAVGVCPPQDQPRQAVTQHPAEPGYKPELDPYVLQTGESKSSDAATRVGKALTCLEGGQLVLNNEGQVTSSMYVQAHPAETHPMATP